MLLTALKYCDIIPFGSMCSRVKVGHRDTISHLVCSITLRRLDMLLTETKYFHGIYISVNTT